MPAVRLAGFYFLFFAVVGAFLPYWALYLEAIGLDAERIGALFATGIAVRIVAPYLWGSIADRRRRRMGVIRTGAVTAAAIFALIPFTRDFGTLVLVIVLYNLFWTAVNPQFEAVTLAHLGARSARYSRLRLWGSVGFIVASAVVGAWLDRAGALELPWLLVALMAGVAALAFAVPEPPAVSTEHRPGEVPAPPLALGAVVPFLLASALMQASHGPYYVFFSIHLESLGFPRGQIGALWALGVVAEVGLFAVMPRILAAAPLPPLFAMCFALTVVRWLALALAPLSLPVLALIQCLHAVSFGAHHAVGIALVHRLFGGGREGRGQALYSSLTFGAGGAAGSAASGWLWASGGSQAAWLAAAALAAAGGLVALGLLRRGLR